MSKISHGFLGTFNSTVDSKGRFMIPVKVKGTILERGGGSRELVLKRNIYDPCLDLYPKCLFEEEYTELESKIKEMNPDHIRYRRKYTSGMREVEIDNSGRILLPKELMKYADIEKNIILAAGIKKFEIWNTNKYNDLMDNHNYSKKKNDFHKIGRKIYA